MSAHLPVHSRELHQHHLSKRNMDSLTMGRWLSQNCGPHLLHMSFPYQAGRQLLDEHSSLAAHIRAICVQDSNKFCNRLGLATYHQSSSRGTLMEDVMVRARAAI